MLKNIFPEIMSLLFRSRTGEGNFNFRFIFDFDYFIGENKIVIQDQKFLSFGKTERKVDPILHLEVWDADFLTRDDFIGELKLNLSDFIRGSKTSKGCDFKRCFHLNGNDLICFKFNI